MIADVSGAANWRAFLLEVTNYNGANYSLIRAEYSFNGSSWIFAFEQAAPEEDVEVSSPDIYVEANYVVRFKFFDVAAGMWTEWSGPMEFDFNNTLGNGSEEYDGTAELPSVTVDSFGDYQPDLIKWSYGSDLVHWTFIRSAAAAVGTLSYELTNDFTSTSYYLQARFRDHDSGYYWVLSASDLYLL
jgi:hypothetical protein